MSARPRLRARDVLGDARLALMLAFGYSAGLPLILVLGTLSARLTEAGVPITTIGLFSWVALAYSFKFLWSPLVDALDVPGLGRLLGRRRAWMLLCQAVVALGLVGVALSDPAQALWPTAAFATLVAFGSASQDVVIDGWRIDAAPESRQGLMAAAYQLGYRLAIICAGAGALYLAEYADWRTAYLVMAGLMVVGAAATLLAPVVDRAPGARGATERFHFATAIVAPLADLRRRQGRALVLILALVALYRLPDFVAGVMANPFYLTLGFTKSEIAGVSKIYGVWVGLAGAFAGGLLIPRLGLSRVLLIGAVAGAASNLMFSWLALEGPKLSILILTISVDNFAGNFAGTALIAYMSGLTGPGFAATQYALLSSLYALPGKLVGGLSGFLVAAFGYPVFFALTAAIGLPVVALWFVLRAVQGPVPGAAPLPGPAEAEDAPAAGAAVRA